MSKVKVWLSVAVVSMTAIVGATVSAAAGGGGPAYAGAPTTPVAYIAMDGTGSLAEVSLDNGDIVAQATGIPSAECLAVTPDGTTAYVGEIDDGNVVPVDLATMTAGSPISVGGEPDAIVITPNGATAYVVSEAPARVVPVDLASGTPGTPIALPAGSDPSDAVITPNGDTIYVSLWGAGEVVPISTSDNTAGTPISLGAGAFGSESLAISPNGATVYTLPGEESGPPGYMATLATASNTLGTPFLVNRDNVLGSVAASPDGHSAFVSSFNTTSVLPVDLTDDTVGTAVTTAGIPNAIQYSSDGSAVWLTVGFGSTSALESIDPSTDRIVNDFPLTGDGPTNFVLAGAANPTTTSLSASTTTPSSGQSVTLTATVDTTPSGQTIPGGAVTFSDGTTTLCVDGLASQATPAVATCSYRWTSVGDQSVTASYSGSGGFGGSASAPQVIDVTSAEVAGYWEVAGDGGIFSYGDAGFYGAGVTSGDGAVIGMAPTPNGHGYWLATAGGAVIPYGDAVSHGSLLGTELAAPIVGIEATPDGGGYWLVGADGGVFAFGDARYHGSAATFNLAKSVVGLAATSDGGGYWLVGADGGVFAFGDARYHGSAATLNLARPVVGIAATSDGGGYELVAADGGVFAYGDADYLGSASGLPLTQPIVGLAITP